MKIHFFDNVYLQGFEILIFIFIFLTRYKELYQLSAPIIIAKLAAFAIGPCFYFQFFSHCNGIHSAMNQIIPYSYIKNFHNNNSLIICILSFIHILCHLCNAFFILERDINSAFIIDEVSSIGMFYIPVKLSGWIFATLLTPLLLSSILIKYLHHDIWMYIHMTSYTVIFIYAIHAAKQFDLWIILFLTLLLEMIIRRHKKMNCVVKNVKMDNEIACVTVSFHGKNCPPFSYFYLSHPIEGPSRPFTAGRVYMDDVQCVDFLIQKVGPWTNSICYDWIGREIELKGPFSTHHYATWMEEHTCWIAMGAAASVTLEFLFRMIEAKKTSTVQFVFITRNLFHLQYLQDSLAKVHPRLLSPRPLSPMVSSSTPIFVKKNINNFRPLLPPRDLNTSYKKLSKVQLTPLNLNQNDPKVEPPLTPITLDAILPQVRNDKNELIITVNNEITPFEPLLKPKLGLQISDASNPASPTGSFNIARSSNIFRNDENFPIITWYCTNNKVLEIPDGPYPKDKLEVHFCKPNFKVLLKECNDNLPMKHIFFAGRNNVAQSFKSVAESMKIPFDYEAFFE